MVSERGLLAFAKDVTEVRVIHIKHVVIIAIIAKEEHITRYPDCCNAQDKDYVNPFSAKKFTILFGFFFCILPPPHVLLTVGWKDIH